MDQPPFTQQHELCNTLAMVASQGGNYDLQEAQNTNPHPIIQYLPGEPKISLMDTNMGAYLEKEFKTPDLDKLAPWMGWMATQDSTHIYSLTKQLVRGREICITEEPRLHLVWYFDKIFIKPIPEYLLSHAFWKFHLISANSTVTDRESILRAICGFMRSYCYLIRHPSDFELATKAERRLIPKSVMSYPDFVRFIQSFEDIQNGAVSPRWNYGQLRLSRLNKWSKIVLGKFTYQKTHGQYGAQFAQFYGPILFVFAVLSVVLSAMSLANGVKPPLSGNDMAWRRFAYTARVFAIVTIICALLIGVVLLSFLVFMILREARFALKTWHRLRKARRMAETGSSGSDKS